MNKKGFAISIVMYSIVFVLISVFYMLLGILKVRYTVSSNLREDIMNELNTKTRVIVSVKNGSLEYLDGDIILNLSYGTYYLVNTTAPTGYQQISGSVTKTVATNTENRWDITFEIGS